MYWVRNLSHSNSHFETVFLSWYLLKIHSCDVKSEANKRNPEFCSENENTHRSKVLLLPWFANRCGCINFISDTIKYLLFHSWYHYWKCYFNCRNPWVYWTIFCADLREKKKYFFQQYWIIFSVSFFQLLLFWRVFVLLLESIK